jgi:hypothetical protein
VEVTGGGAAASAGDVLKSTLVPISGFTTNITGSWSSMLSHTHTPIDAQSYLHISFTGLWRLLASGNATQDGQWRISIFVNNSAVGDCFMFNYGTVVAGNSGPCVGRYTVASLAPLPIEVRAIQTSNFTQSRFFLNYGYQSSSNFLSIDDIKR